MVDIPSADSMRAYTKDRASYEAIIMHVRDSIMAAAHDRATHVQIALSNVSDDIRKRLRSSLLQAGYRVEVGGYWFTIHWGPAKPLEASEMLPNMAGAIL